jgi:3-hydroxyacyl-CoA dehydrogenase/enoyl-CoA hydratase/carnithine racemase
MTANRAFTLAFPEPDVAVLTFDLPGKGANILSSWVLDEFETHLAELEQRDGLAGLVIRSGKPGMFIAGADLREFAASLDAPKPTIVEVCRRGQKLFQRLSRTAFVTVAAIDGVCLGGGAELAIWCDRRVLSTGEKTQFGFPEVKLGLFPGWGGTVRASRIIGLANAVELVTSGDSVDARAAAALGLADDVAMPDALDEAAVRLVRAEQQSGQYRQDRQRWSEPIRLDETELAFLGATASAYIQQKTKGHYPAPMAALEVLLGGALVDADAALEMEAAGMAELFGSPVNAALIHVFFLSDHNKKDTGVAGPVQPRSIASVAVIGAGIMGAGIAAAAARRGLPVAITDANAEALARGVQNVIEEAAYDKSAGAPTAARMLQLAPLVNGTTSDDELAAADLVIEAVVENLDVKRQVYARLEPRLGDDAILASNTSTIPIARLAEGLARPERFLGIHFFNPVRKMPLVEVIRGPRTDDQTVATAVALAKRIGKSPIVVNDGPGFLVNRLLLPYMNEAVELVLDGVPIDDVDKAARRFGMPMGPIALFDVVGLDTALYAGSVMAEAFPDRAIKSPLVERLVQAGRLGQKSGAGFFKYGGKDKKGQPDPALEDLLRPLVRGAERISREQIVDRLFMPMLLEATRVIAENIVRDVRDVDLGLIWGIGFPPFRGGLLFWADTLGPVEILKRLEPLRSLGSRMEPTPMLEELARGGKKFYR